LLSPYFKKVKISRGEVHIYLKNYNFLENTLYFLKNNLMCQFKILIDICGIDFIHNSKERFEINYNLLSIKYTLRLHIKVNVNEFIAVPSIIKIFRNAN
jgi:NADH-quinone oxidoreductase subunit C